LGQKQTLKRRRGVFALSPKEESGEPATLKVSPAMAAGVTDRLWEMADVVEMTETFEGKRKRGAG
jgi:hypothetical protein